MKAANWHTYQILTKRAGRMQKLLKGKLNFAAEQPHIWWGVSVENRQHGLPRIDLFRDSPAQVRFLSIEPLLEHLGPVNLKGINWVIVGGESGPGARPMAADWVRDIRAQCHRRKSPSFSSNGAASAKPKPDGNWTGAPMMNFLNAGKLRFLIWNSGGTLWSDWRRNWFNENNGQYLPIGLSNHSTHIYIWQKILPTNPKRQPDKTNEIDRYERLQNAAERQIKNIGDAYNTHASLIKIFGGWAIFLAGIIIGLIGFGFYHSVSEFKHNIRESLEDTMAGITNRVEWKIKEEDRRIDTTIDERFRRERKH